MKKKTEKIISFREYLQETRAREKSASLKEYTDILLFGDKVRNVLETLKDEGFSIYEGVLDTTQVDESKEFERSDFTVSKEDISFLLYLLFDSLKGQVHKDFLRGLFDVLQTNPKIAAIIIVWNFEELPSCA